jgi:hypothetical protein
MYYPHTDNRTTVKMVNEHQNNRKLQLRVRY